MKSNQNRKASESSLLDKIGIVNFTLSIGVVALIIVMLYTAFSTNFFQPSTAEKRRITQLYLDASVSKVLLAQMVQEEKNALGDVDVRWYEKKYEEAFRALQDEVGKVPEGAVSPDVKDFIQYNTPTVSALVAEGDVR